MNTKTLHTLENILKNLLYTSIGILILIGGFICSYWFITEGGL
jgi:hypothetical protein